MAEGEGERHSGGEAAEGLRAASLVGERAEKRRRACHRLLGQPDDHSGCDEQQQRRRNAGHGVGESGAEKADLERELLAEAAVADQANDESARELSYRVDGGEHAKALWRAAELRKEKWKVRQHEGDAKHVDEDGEQKYVGRRVEKAQQWRWPHAVEKAARSPRAKALRSRLSRFWTSEWILSGQEMSGILRGPSWWRHEIP